jgi:hypothetical protein
MIEHVIADKLLKDEKVQKYCGNSVFAVYTQDGTHTRYLTVTESDKPVGDDVVYEFDLTVEIYDYDKDKRKVINLSQHLKKLLHRADDLIDPNGIYTNIRLFYAGRNHTMENDSTLSRMFLSFTARATEEETNETNEITD